MQWWDYSFSRGKLTTSKTVKNIISRYDFHEEVSRECPKNHDEMTLTFPVFYGNWTNTDDQSRNECETIPLSFVISLIKIPLTPLTVPVDSWDALKQSFLSLSERAREKYERLVWKLSLVTSSSFVTSFSFWMILDNNTKDLLFTKTRLEIYLPSPSSHASIFRRKVLIL